MTFMWYPYSAHARVLSQLFTPMTLTCQLCGLARISVVLPRPYACSSRPLLGEARPGLDAVHGGHLAGALLVLLAPALAAVEAGRPRVGVVHGAGGVGLCVGAGVVVLVWGTDVRMLLGGGWTGRRGDGPWAGCMGTAAADEVLCVMMPLLACLLAGCCSWTKR